MTARFKKLSLTDQEIIKNAALMLRYNSLKPTPRARKFASYSTIAKILNLAYNKVQHLCRYKSKVTKATIAKRKLHKLDDHHERFLLSVDTLKKWAGLTLKERATLFHRRFPNKRIAASSLSRLYLANGVKNKVVR